jgi:hypothetical protein
LLTIVRGPEIVTDRCDIDVVTGGVVEGALRADPGVTIEIVAEAPRQCQARIYAEAPTVDALVAIEVYSLRVVVGKHQVVEQFLASREGQVRQPLQRKLLGLNKVLIPDALHADERVFEFVEQTEIRECVA